MVSTECFITLCSLLSTSEPISVWQHGNGGLNVDLVSLQILDCVQHTELKQARYAGNKEVKTQLPRKLLFKIVQSLWGTQVDDIYLN